MTILVIGASRGLGYEFCKYFKSQGHQVIGVGRTPLTQIKNNEIFFDYCQFDVTSIEADTRLEKFIELHSNAISGLVNNVGKSNWRSLKALDTAFIDEMFNINLKQMFLVTRLVVQKCHNLNAIVNMASIAGRRGSKNNSVYSGLKFGVVGLTQSLAKELGATGIRVNCVSPVLIETTGLKDALDDSDSPLLNQNLEEYFTSFASSQSALERLPSAEEVASVIDFLLSEKSSAITGQNVNVDCGVFPQ
jgi:NAD(P)-dependent dehydrogenase (short-subunit alcohol dehydrogenase family)